MREIVPPTNSSRSAASGSSARGPSGFSDVEIDAVRHDVHAVGLDAGVEVHLAHEGGGHPDLVDVVLQSAACQSRGSEPNSQGWISARRPPAGRVRSGGHWWRTSTSGVCGVGAIAERPVGGAPLEGDLGVRRAQALADLAVDRREARRGRLVADPADGDRRARAPRRDREVARVDRLELVDVVGEGRGAAMPPCRRSSRPGSPAGARARPRARPRNVRRTAGRSARARRSRGCRPCSRRSPARGPRGTRRRRAARSPTRATGSRRHRDPRGSRAARRARTRRRARRRRGDPARASCSANARGTSPWMRTRISQSTSCAASTSSCGPLCGVGRADEADGQHVTDAARPPVAPDRVPDRAVLGHRLVDDVDHLAREAEARAACAASPRRRRGPDRRAARTARAARCGARRSPRRRASRRSVAQLRPPSPGPSHSERSSRKR